MNNNYYTRNIPSFMNNIRSKKNLGDFLFSTATIKKINGTIDNVQKVIKVYERARPIIEQTKPMIDNIKTTFKVAKAFKSFSSTNDLESAFDNLPDYDEKEVEHAKSMKDDVLENSKVAKPFIP